MSHLLSNELFNVRLKLVHHAFLLASYSHHVLSRTAKKVKD